MEGIVDTIVVSVMAQCRYQQGKLIHNSDALADLHTLGHGPVTALEDTKTVPHVVIWDLVVLREDFGREGGHDLFRELAALHETSLVKD